MSRSNIDNPPKPEPPPKKEPRVSLVPLPEEKAGWEGLVSMLPYASPEAILLQLRKMQGDVDATANYFLEFPSPIDHEQKAHEDNALTQQKALLEQYEREQIRLQEEAAKQEAAKQAGKNPIQTAFGFSF